MKTEDLAQVAGKAKALMAQGAFAEAEPILRRVLQLFGEAFGKKHIMYVEALSDLALACHELGKYEEAKPLLLQTRDEMLAAGGKDAPHHALALSNLGCCYAELGETGAAREALSEAKRIFALSEYAANTNALYGYCTSNLASVSASLGDFEEAIELHHEANSVFLKEFGKNSQDYAVGLSNLGVALALSGELAEAERLHAEAMGILQKALGKRSPDYAAGLLNLAGVRAALLRPTEAKDILEEAKDIIDTAYRSDHPAAVRCAKSLQALEDSAQGILGLQHAFLVAMNFGSAGALINEEAALQAQLRNAST